MSGIAGIWSMSGEVDARSCLEQLSSILSWRGRDRIGHWMREDIIFVHALLATTAEAERETNPLRLDESGCTIVGDIRLDNRPWLLGELGYSDEGLPPGDCELALRSYLKWGLQAPEMLLGDFAFVIHDPRDESLFGARDPMGVRQVAYHHRPGEVFLFATDADSIARFPCISPRFNHQRLADFFDNLEGSSFTSTFFEEVCRLPPGHSFAVNIGGFQQHRYWRPRPLPVLQLDTSQAYVSAFREVFTEAVRCRLRSSREVGSMLSGGLDSGAITAVACSLLSQTGGALTTLSAVDSVDPECIETKLIRLTIANNHSLRPILVDRKDIGHPHTPQLQELSNQAVEPFDYTSVLNRSLYMAARSLGVRVVLDGAAGDVVMNPGNRVASLLADRQFHLAFREARAQAAFWGSRGNWWKVLAPSVWSVFAPRMLRKARRGLVDFVRSRRSEAAYGRLDRRFLRSSGLIERRREYRRRLDSRVPYGGDYLARVLEHPNLTVGRERYDRVAAQCGVEARDPFTDRRVVEFCLSLPAQEFQDGGFPKILLRRMLEGVVPSEVVWRRGKTHLGAAFLSALPKSAQFNPATLPEELRSLVGPPHDARTVESGWYRVEWHAMAKWLLHRRGLAKFGHKTK